MRLSALGDVVQCLPALAALRAARPELEIGWLVEDRNAGLLAGHPGVDRLFVFRRKAASSGMWAGLGALRALRRELRDWGPETAVDLQGNLKGAFLARLSGATRRIGLPAGEAREGAHLLATHTVGPADAGEHRADRAMRLVAALGAAEPAEPQALPVPGPAREAVARRLGEMGLDAGGFALLMPGTSDFGAFKRWPDAGFAALARRLREELGVPSLVAHGPGQRPLAEAVAALSGEAARVAPETADLKELLALVDASRLVVGADSGPVLLASTRSVPTVALFGPKDPGIYGPRGARTAVVWKQVYCSPCTLRRCGDPICMTTMSVDEVWEGVLRALADGPLSRAGGPGG